MRVWLRILLCAFVTVTTLFTAEAAFAQKPIKDELPTKELKDAWEAGRDLMADGSYAEARVQFEAVYRQTKNPRVLHNLAITWKEDGYFAQALGAWEKQLASRDKLSDKEEKRAENAIKVVQEFVTTLELKSNQTGATLFIKGIEIGKTPFLGKIPIDQGPNEIKLQKTGFVTVVRNIDVAKDTPVKLELNMVPADKMGTVDISVSGADNATIFMDGAELGKAPYKGDVPVGEHTFEARAKDYVTAIQKSEVKFGQQLSITISMSKELKEGKVRIKTDHADAVIKIDGVTKGTGTWEGVLPQGGHKLEVSKDGYQTYASEVAVATDQERVIDVTLEEDMTAYWVYWAVTGVVVAAGAGVASFFVLSPADEPVVSGTFPPGTVETGADVGITVFSF